MHRRLKGIPEKGKKLKPWGQEKCNMAGIAKERKDKKDWFQKVRHIVVKVIQFIKFFYS